MTRNTRPHGISGTVKWSIDNEGLMLFEPIDDSEGMLNEPEGVVGDKLERGWNCYCEIVKRIKAVGKIYLPIDSSFMFCDCSSLIDFDSSNFDTSKTLNMHSMFCGCSSLTSLDLSNFDTSNVKDMSYMFYRCYSLRTLNLSCLKRLDNKRSFFMLKSCNSLSNLMVPKCTEKATNSSILPAMLCSYVPNSITVLLEYFEKFLNTDLSEEKKRLKVILRKGHIDGITAWKAENRPDEKVRGILKILQAHKVGCEELKTNNFQLLVEMGVVSDINAYLSGVPLEDILA